MVGDAVGEVVGEIVGDEVLAMMASRSATRSSHEVGCCVVGFRVGATVGSEVGFVDGEELDKLDGLLVGFGVWPKLVLLETQQSLLSPTAFGVSVMVDHHLQELPPNG